MHEDCMQISIKRHVRVVGDLMASGQRCLAWASHVFSDESWRMQINPGADFMQLVPDYPALPD